MSLVAWYPLNNNLKNIVSSEYNIIEKQVSYSNYGKIGKAINFPNHSLTDTLTINTNPIQSDTFSTTAWLYIEGNETGNNFTFISSRKSMGTGIGIWISCATNELFMDIVGNVRWRTGIIINRNRWFHLSIIFNKGTVKVYIDGILKATKTGQPKDLTSLATNMYVGASTSSSSGSQAAINFWQGRMNDIRFYDHCLSEAEVKEISKGLVCHYRLDGVGANENLILRSDKIISASSASGITGTPMEDGSFKIVSTSGNGNWCSLSFAKGSSTNVGQKMSVGDIYTISCDIKVEEGEQFPTLFINSGNSYTRLIGNISKKNVWQRVYYTKTWNDPRYTIW